MPILTSLAGCLPVTSTPRKRTLPAEGRNVPLITLKSVVFPAPLGPMKPQIWRSGTSMLTSFKAATPPKYFVSPWTSRIFTASPEKIKQLAQQSYQAIRLQEDNDDQQCSIQQKMDLRKFDCEPFLHDTKNCSAQHRSPDGSNPANHREQQDRNSCGKGENASGASAGINIDVVTGMQSSGNSRQGGGDRVCPQLERIGVHSKVRSRFLVLLDGPERQAKSALCNPGGDGHCHGQDHQRLIIMLRLTKLSILIDAITTGTAGKREVAHQHPHRFGNA